MTLKHMKNFSEGEEIGLVLGVSGRYCTTEVGIENT